MRGPVAVLAVLTALSLPNAGRAALVLSLSSTAPDLSALQVGQSVTFQVSLGGVTAGDRVEYLAAKVEFDPAFFATPSITAGAIVPDTAGFVGSPFGDAADGNYDSLFTGLPITDNGLFFSFESMVKKSGSGSLRFGFVDAQGTDSGGAALGAPVAGGDLHFEASPTAAVPAPPSALLLAAGLATAALARPRRGQAP